MTLPLRTCMLIIIWTMTLVMVKSYTILYYICYILYTYKKIYSNIPSFLAAIVYIYASYCFLPTRYANTALHSWCNHLVIAMYSRVQYYLLVQLKTLFGFHVTWCEELFSLAETPQLPPSPCIWTPIARTLLVSKDRRHLFVPPDVRVRYSGTHHEVSNRRGKLQRQKIAGK